MAYDVKFYKTKRPATSPDDLTPDNLDDMGSGDELQRQLAPVIPEFIWQRPFYLGSGHMFRRATGYPLPGNTYSFMFLDEPSNSYVHFEVLFGERLGREEFVQRICDALGWVAVVDRWEPPHPKSRLFLVPRRSIDSSARHP